MRMSYLAPALLTTCLAVPFAHGEESDGVRVAPTSMTTQVDAGQIMKGNRNYERIDEAFIQRTSVWITQEVLIGDRLDVRAGVGGLFWYSIPGPTPGYSNVGPFVTTTKFGPGITRADMAYRFGDPQNPVATLQAGFFPYKYNPDAKNLGEYLLRSGTYPGYLTTGGWNILSEAGFMMQGLRLNVSLWDGKFQSEFLLPIERELPPNGDISPTYIGSLKPVRGIELGGGVTCNHCISVKPSATSPERKYSSSSTELDKYGNGSGVIIRNPSFVDSLPVTDLFGSNPKYIYDSTNFYTFQGIKLMARASVDPKAFVPMSFLGPEDLKVFGEIAVLGWKNYPFYYEKRSERMPIMFGFNAPTRIPTPSGSIKLLDLLTFQMEYYNSRFPNSMDNAYRYQMPTFPFVDSTGIAQRDPNLFDPDSKEVTRDNWKWSVYAKREIVKGMRLYGQVANDHLRVPYFTGEHSALPVTNIQGRDWYYLVRFELGI
jgi:hypothetical protein